jgi:thiol-disulfide isomerase/thioredoxin
MEAAAEPGGAAPSRAAVRQDPAPHRGPLAGVRARRARWIAGVLLLVVAAPVAWYVTTQPLVTPRGAAGVGTGSPAKGIAPLVGYEAPNITLRDPSGRPIELKQFRGRPVLVNFWATWCVPCREEMPELEQVYRRYQAEGLVVLAVSIDAEASAGHVPDYLKEGSPAVGSYTFPVALDTKQEVARAYQLAGVPASFFVDRAGVIRAVQPGAMNRQTLLDRLRTVVDVGS